MKIVLLNQSSSGSPQIPSVAANLASASGDLAALASLGVEHGVNTGLADSGADATKTITQKTKENFDSQLSNMPTFATATWFSHNIETSSLVQAIRHGPANQAMPTDANGFTIPYLVNKNSQMKAAMRELVARSDYTYDETSVTLLSGGAVPTYTEFYDAMVSCMAETMQYLRSQFAGSTLYDWRSGAKPLPWLGVGNGWWTNPEWETDQFGYYRPNRTSDGTQVYQLSGTELTLSTGAESAAYDAAYWDAGLLTQTRKTAEHTAPIVSQAPADMICYTAYVNPSTDDLQTVNPAVSASGYYPVGVGGSGIARFVPRQSAIDSIYKAIRYSWLEHYKALGHRIGVYTQPIFDFWTNADPHWGLSCSDEEWVSVKLDAMFDPVSADEATRHGLPQGLVVGGGLVFWNNTDSYLKFAFGASPNAAAYQGQYNGEWICRRNLIRRATGRTNVQPDWTTAYASNQWYQALAAILTEDMISRIQVTRNRIEKAKRQGAAKQSTLASIREDNA